MSYVNNPEAGCHYYNYFDAARMGTALQERLVGHMVRDGRFQVLERKTIQQVYAGEHMLINSQRSSQKIAKGYFKQAKYTLVGVVKSFEWCSGGGGANVNVGKLFGIGDLNVGVKKDHATVEVEIRVIDTLTGEVIHSESGSADRSGMNMGLAGNIKSVNFGGNQFKNSLLGHAIDEAIRNAATAVLSDLPGAA
jgi:curli biogenesis system outer membrane secretion channel CsgG